MILKYLLFVYRCLVGPALTRKYEKCLVPRAIPYRPSHVESWSSHVLNVMIAFLPYAMYFVPSYMLFQYFLTGTYNFSDRVSKYIIDFAPATTVLMYMLRTIGRARNPLYKEFMRDYHSPTYATNFSTYVKTIRNYDFEFSRWPVTYSVEPKLSRWETMELIQHNPFSSNVNKYLGKLNKIFTQMVAFSLAHSFSARIAFPGKTPTMPHIHRENLDEGRDDYVIKYNGKRAKISTADGNTLDVMYVNQDAYTSGKSVLVICCEGNFSFYETGIMKIAVRCGYSALGWNYPGFANSSGIPFPRKLRNSADAVMKYAKEVLCYSTKNIVLYGWSLGGYTAMYAATLYPSVRGVILEATFDDLFLIVKSKFSPKLSHIFREVIRCYFNMNIGNLMMSYDGPLVIVRHIMDEVNSLVAGSLDTNRSNSLVVKLITQRYPEFCAVHYVSTLITNSGLPEKTRDDIQKIQSVPEVKKCLYLISKHMKDCLAPSNMPPPDELFENVMKEISVQGIKASDNKGAERTPG